MLAMLAFASCSLEDPLTSIPFAQPIASRDLGPPQRVFAKRFVTPIRDAPSPDGSRIGYLRAGALLHSTTTEPVGHEGCEDGWYELDTGGYACRRRDILVFSGDRLPELRARQPDREAVLPYEYMTARQATPIYKRLPREGEIYDIGNIATEAPAPGSAERSQTIDNPLVLRILWPGFYVSLDRTFDRNGETYWRTQQNGFVAAKHLRRKPWSEFRGQALDALGWGLPVAVTRADATTIYRVNERGKVRATRDRLERRTWLPVRARRQIGDRIYLVLQDQKLVRESDIELIAPADPPAEVGEGERWIDIDLAHQVLVAYEGTRPRYVTLVSTGRSRAPHPELDYRTPKGLYRIRSKDLTSTMDDDAPGAPPYSLEDVPYVMYFKGAYAFHSTFWHDRFGRPRSHGCINLAPYDAKWLYNWAGPDLPEIWHGGSATAENPGTWVYIHGETP